MSEKITNALTGILDISSLPDEALSELKVAYRPVPGEVTVENAGGRPVWRACFQLVTDPNQQFGLDVNGEVILGRDMDAPDLVDLGPYGAADLGVSRRHLMLRPTATNLFVIDLGSTNGTMRNGRSIGFNMPYSLTSGDTLSLGQLQLVVHIVHRPLLQTALLERKPDLASALSQIAKSITSQLDLDDVLNQVAETAMTLTSAGETGIWLVDETSGDLFLEAERGIEDERIRRTRLPIREDTPAGKVIKTSQPLRARRRPGEGRIKVVTNYLVEALVYVPITLGGVTFGVLAATHRQPGKQFDERDERLLGSIADFAAIAIQNARQYQATDRALARRYKELSALNEVARAVSASLDLGQVYEVLVEQVNKHWPVEAVRLCLLDEQQNILRPFDAAKVGTGMIAYPINKGILGKVAQSGKVIVTNDAPSHPDYAAEIDGFDGQVPRSVACVPLRIQEQVVGVLTLVNKADGPFTDEDVGRLEAFANPVATAIENARLFAESERQRAAIQATAQTLSQPLLIIDENGNVLIANQPARRILDTHMAQWFEGISSGVGHTSEIIIGDQTYLSSSEHLPEVGTIIVMQDITYVKQLEADRSEFLHALSHDLKNPLTSIVGWAGLLEKTHPLDENGRRFVARIMAVSDRMVGMINQLLQTVAGDEAILIERQPCQLEQIVSKILSDVEGAALNKAITVELELSGQPYPILADGTRLYHMVLNLVDNAIKYTTKNTAVTVELTYSDEAITIRVRDEGPGIPEKDLPRIFDKYFRSMQVNIQPGSGLGLSVVRSIAEAHGGEVAANNLPGGGVAFTITLPGNLRLPTTET